MAYEGLFASQYPFTGLLLWHHLVPLHYMSCFTGSSFLGWGPSLSLASRYHQDPGFLR